MTFVGPAEHLYYSEPGTNLSKIQNTSFCEKLQYPKVSFDMYILENSKKYYVSTKYIICMLKSEISGSLGEGGSKYKLSAREGKETGLLY